MTASADFSATAFPTSSLRSTSSIAASGNSRPSGVNFQTNAHVGVNISVESLRENYDAILLCGGSEQPRDLPIPGRELKGVHFAMEFLPQQNRRNEGDTENKLLSNMMASEPILATGKHVIIIGGGDTGADCLGTSHRQGAKSVHQFEIMPKPPAERSPNTPWPLWPLQLRTESAHEEGGIRDWSINSVKFTGDENGNVKQLHCVRVQCSAPSSRPSRKLSSLSTPI